MGQFFGRNEGKIEGSKVGLLAGSMEGYPEG